MPGSPTWNTHVADRGTPRPFGDEPSVVITAAIPTPGPSRSSRSRRSADSPCATSPSASRTAANPSKATTIVGSRRPSVARRSISSARRRSKRVRRSISEIRTTAPQCAIASTGVHAISPWASTTYRCIRSGVDVRAHAATTPNAAVVVPAPTEPTRSRLPSPGVQSSGRRHWLAGSSSTPTDRRSSARSRGWTTVGKASIHGRCGLALPIMVAAVQIDSTRCSSTVGPTTGGTPPEAAPPRVPPTGSIRRRSVRGGSGPAVLAVWNTTSSSGPSRSIARPGAPTGNRAGESSPTTSFASPRSCKRSAMRRLVFARMSSVTTPAGRCVASSRWMPRLRPRWAIATSAPRKSGSSLASDANSSITTTRRGSGSSTTRR